MAAINSALEIDLSGQICADSIGHKVYSGIGGYVDFMHGASSAFKGKTIIVLPSTSSDGRKSRIVSHLTSGAGVVSSRSNVRYIVTEFGIAYLHGKTIRERALALINIAHPRFRERLLAEAKQLHYVYDDQVLPAIYEPLYPGRWETHQIFPGTSAYFSPDQADRRASAPGIFLLPPGPGHLLPFPFRDEGVPAQKHAGDVQHRLRARNGDRGCYRRDRE